MDPFSITLLTGVVATAAAYLKGRRDNALHPYRKFPLEIIKDWLDSLLDDDDDEKPIDPSPTEAKVNALREVKEAEEEARDRIAQHQDNIRQALTDLAKDEQVQTQSLAELDQLEATVSQAKSKLDTILKQL